ncbi:hypothetical protein BKA62DRAFT_742362 [Auriculariales sp. MPI-PUGE-AT-0066]|nr:hypothetical protein BKA62DRAFT_742362 [Auriculariales sp. MPI-PUGE-AT-0066]
MQHARSLALTTSRILQFHAYTLWLFTQSDMKTLMVPQTIFATASYLAGCSDRGNRTVPSGTLVSRAPLMLFWIWINLLHVVVSNQRQPEAIVEDLGNKPWRPLPAGRLSRRGAAYIFFAALTLGFAASYALHVITPFLIMVVLSTLYSEADIASRYVWARGVFNAGGVASFGWGALSVLSGREALGLTARDYAWVALSGAAVLTTIQVADLPDIDGDRDRDRITAPLVYGQNVTRASVGIAVGLWSIVSPRLWVSEWVLASVAPLIAAALLMLALILANLWQSMDMMAYCLWCTWISILYLSPVLGSVAA